jgi:pyruvate,water dikinase
MNMSYIRSFHEVGADPVGLVGGKGANLGQMTRNSLCDPIPGFLRAASCLCVFVVTHLPLAE